MPAQWREGAYADWPSPVEFVRTTAEAIWAHWGAWQEVSEGWEDCGTPAPEPHPMAALWDTPCGTERYAFRTRVTALSVGAFSAELRTYDPCEILVGVGVEPSHGGSLTLPRPGHYGAKQTSSGSNTRRFASSGSRMEGAGRSRYASALEV